MKGKMGGVAVFFAAAGLLLSFLVFGPAGAQEQGDWRTEFEAVCGKTDTSMALSSEELTSLIARCDKLAEKIAAEAETVRKVYLRRLKMCRDLFAYVLESKKPEEAKGNPSLPAQPPTSAEQQPPPQQPSSPGQPAPAPPPPSAEQQPSPQPQPSAEQQPAPQQAPPPEQPAPAQPTPVP